MELHRFSRGRRTSARRDSTGRWLTLALCLVFALGPPVCRLSPVAERELRDDRNWLLIEETAGGTKGPQENGPAGANLTAVQAARDSRTEEARRRWLALIDTVPNHPEPYINLWRLEELLGKNGQPALERLCENKKLSPEQLTAMFELLRGSGRSGEAVELARVLRKCRRAPEPLLIAVSQHFIFRKQYRAALDALDEVLAKAPAHPQALTLSGLVYAAAKERGRARTYLEAAIRAKAGYPELRTTLGRVYLASDLPAEALLILEQPDRGSDPDSVLEVRIRASVLLDWKANTTASFRAFLSDDRRARLREELYAGEDGARTDAAELELRELY